MGIKRGRLPGFQSAPPRGGRLAVLLRGGHRRSHPHRFNPRPRVGGDCQAVDEAPVDARFNPRPAWGATASSRRHQHDSTVSIRAPAWGATTWYLLVVPPSLEAFQSAPPRGGRPGRLVRRADLHADLVSIRAPAWGATGSTRVFGLMAVPPVSIRAPAWGATCVPPQLEAMLTGVSIRAPAWGATRRDDALVAAILKAFQSAPPRGGRP